ncbi:pyridoxamine kinase [Gehongia tenuis]|uniref:pyridoxal kinase n=1 Tax=Gehongia tenuis TaxID=2763655 RepID=A0A926HNJ3_9FIRM|nr:pyridoxamine kinase [Gehongia tenuis]MBC8530674.1 pyridoxamine kinase [Gehongia tenuis]
MIKKVAAIHDLSGFGRASLCTIIPILSTLGVQVCPLPTAVLSTHTGGFQHYSFLDLTDNMVEMIGHWKELGLRFECVYSGFLGSPRQIAVVADFIDHFGKDNLVVVDPVMGDDGRLYSSMTEEMTRGMRGLVKKANIITPNFTEAAFLLGKDVGLRPGPAELKDWLLALSDLGPETVVITSAPAESERSTAVIAYDRRNETFWKVGCPYVPASYPGTGDAFASVLIGGLLGGDSLPVALDRAVQFIYQCIKASYGFDYPRREGVLLERELGLLKMPVLISGYEMV